MMAEEPPMAMTQEEVTVQDDLLTYNIIHWDNIKCEWVTTHRDEKEVYCAFMQASKALQQELRMKQKEWGAWQAESQLDKAAQKAAEAAMAEQIESEDSEPPCTYLSAGSMPWTGMAEMRDLDP